MEDIIEIFEKIDKDGNGYVSREELSKYATENNQDTSLVDDLLKWFDTESTGKITANDVELTLGVLMSDKYRQKVKSKAKKEKLYPGFELMHQSEVPKDILEHVIATIKACDADKQVSREPKDIAKYLKRGIEPACGIYWQVLVAGTSVGCAVGHEPNHFIYLRYRNYLYILYRTPQLA